MATKSSNTQGNPYHDEKTGEFTSANDSGEKLEKIESQISLKPGVDLSTIKKPSVKMKEGMNLQHLVDRLTDLNQVANIPKLRSARDIEDNIENYFSRQVTDKLNEMWGMSSDCGDWQFHPKSNRYISLNLFTCVLGKYRYKDNHAHLVSSEEFDKILSPNEFNYLMNEFYRYGGSFPGTIKDLQPIFRGLSDSYETRMKIIDSYGTLDLNNYDIYGNGVYGTNIYTTVSMQYARSYGQPIYGILDTRGAYYLNQRQLGLIQRDLNATVLEQRISSKLASNGIDPTRAAKIAKSFSISVKRDISLISVLLGLDFQVCDNHQRNILNLNRWYIRRER